MERQRRRMTASGLCLASAVVLSACLGHGGGGQATAPKPGERRLEVADIAVTAGYA
jgi:hypothetical protein